MITWEYVLGFILLYTVLATIVQKKDWIPDSFSIWGPILTIRSEIGLDTIESLANRYYKFWVPWGTLGVFASIVTAFVGVFFVVVSVFGVIMQPNEVTIQGPTDMIVIPGVNRFLPLSAGPEILLGLIIGMVVHEMGHAILCRVGDINVKSTGVILGALIPLGAFVEPDEESSEKATLKAQLRMYAAGIMNNFAIFALSIIGLFLIVSLLISPAPGIGVSNVLGDSPAERMDISDGDRITGVNNETITSQEQFLSLLEDDANTLTINEEKVVNIEGSAYVTKVPDGFDLKPKDTIREVNGNRVNSPSELRTKMLSVEDNYATLTLENGNDVEYPVGAYITSEKRTGLMEDMNLSTGESTFVFSVNDVRVYDGQSLINEFNNTESANITYLDKNGDVVTKTVSVDSGDDSAVISSNISSLSTSLLGVNIYPAEQFYNLLTPADSIIGNLQNVLGLLLLPLASLTPGIESNFPGFTPYIQNFYVMSGVPEFSVGGLYFTANVFFWTAWMNFNLAIFNCIPTFALDGGHILRASSEMALQNHISDVNISRIVKIIKGILLACLSAIFFVPIIL
jgi:membrane-associated protease RseP (regulator of RpoE activity)